ncbi:MAG: crossover junction endodeoxyribonuclease RuvC [Prevotellaceae bacterium]|jgi:crossover junction endodeoxyribonuclease RuvC|nr:crossover junction endodeoxyribonuclease RuvC [Prevotellaceae bacterium]
MQTDRIIMGIDPGTTVMGYGVIRIAERKPELVVMGVIELKKFGDHYIKLQKIFERVTQIIAEYLPDEVAIEAPFFGKNVQSMLKLGRAQGVAIAAALSRDVPICEYAPRKIKQMITGQGEASKEQVAAMLKSMFGIKELPKDLDATDGLAAAVCHYYSTTSVMAQIAAEKQKTTPKKVAKKSSSSWENFVAKNPDKVK